MSLRPSNKLYPHVSLLRHKPRHSCLRAVTGVTAGLIRHGCQAHAYAGPRLRRGAMGARPGHDAGPRGRAAPGQNATELGALTEAAGPRRGQILVKVRFLSTMMYLSVRSAVAGDRKEAA
jgi:hypothetical protein